MTPIIYKKVYRPSRRTTQLIKVILAVLACLVILLVLGLKLGFIAPDPRQPNYAGLLISVLVLIASLLLVPLRECVVITDEYIESRLVFPVRLQTSQIRGWRSRLPNGRGDVRFYGKEAGSNVVLVSSAIERDAFLESWIANYPMVD